MPTDAAALATFGNTLNWDGERLFQAAKFGTEMQYQHLVFEEFARKIQPNINVFLVPDGFDATLNPSIVAEFAHVVYRFGHSMLTESIDRFDPGFNDEHIGLIEGFLNPIEFASQGDAMKCAGAIVRGMTRQAGNEIDEFVTSALRNNLLGLPLDLATINLARGRDTGVPSLNAARRDFYEATNNDTFLKPYESWADFAANLKNEASIINFVAAYGTHALITSQTTIEGKRDAALTLITGSIRRPRGSGRCRGLPQRHRRSTPAARSAASRMSTSGSVASPRRRCRSAACSAPPSTSSSKADGEPAERRPVLLPAAPRRPASLRRDGEQLLRVDDHAQHGRDAPAVGRVLDSRPHPRGRPDQAVQSTSTATAFSKAPIRPAAASSPASSRATTRPPRGRTRTTCAIPATSTSCSAAPTASDTLIAGIGDDTLYGDGGNDIMEGGFGNDIHNAGAGDDIIRDMGGDDNIKAGDGNDVVHAGPGLDLVMGGTGQDFIFLGTDMGSEVFAGEGNDFIYGNKNAERILGNEGNDWIETGTFDGAPGDNFDEIFAHDDIDGHDVFLGDGGFDEFIGEGGDDIMVGSLGRGKMVGMSGFDWATYKDSTFGVNADLSIPIIFDEAPTLPQNAALDEYAVD